EARAADRFQLIERVPGVGVDAVRGQIPVRVVGQGCRIELNLLVGRVVGRLHSSRQRSGNIVGARHADNEGYTIGETPTRIKQKSMKDFPTMKSKRQTIR